jgi:hypothetical protein
LLIHSSYGAYFEKMTIWSCTVFQANMRCLPQIESILTTPAIHEFDVWKRGGGQQDETMRLYIDRVKTTDWGKTIDLMMDMQSKPFFVRGERPHVFKMTTRLNVHLFKVQGWPYLIGIFARNKTTMSLRIALKQIYKKQTGDKENPLLKVAFGLHEHDEALLQCFPNMEKLKVRGIHGLHVREASFKGITLEESAEYQKYVKDPNFGGQIMNFSVPVNNETVTMSTIGNMHSSQGGQRAPIDTVLEALRNLLLCHALVYEPTIDQYTQHSEENFDIQSSLLSHTH